MAFRDPVIDRRFCKPHAINMGQSGGHDPYSQGDVIHDDYGSLLLKRFWDQKDHVHLILDSAGTVIATLRKKAISWRLNGWNLYRGRSTEERDIICKAESDSMDTTTYIYLGSKFKNRQKSKDLIADYRIVGSRRPMICKTNSRNPIGHQVHNICVSSTNSGPKIRVYPGADYVFVFALNFIHDSWFEFTWHFSNSLVHTLCSCCNCAGASLNLHPPSRYQTPLPLTVCHIAPTGEIGKVEYYGDGHDADCPKDLVLNSAYKQGGGSIVDSSHGCHQGLNYGAGRNRDDIMKMVVAFCVIVGAVISFSPMIKLLVLITLISVIFSCF